MLHVEDRQLVFRVDRAVGTAGTTPTEGTEAHGRTALGLVDDGPDTEPITHADVGVAVAVALGTGELILTHQIDGAHAQ